MSIRLNKLLARRGIGARRKCDLIIQSGAVRVNGEVVTEPGTMVEPERDRVLVNNKPLPPAADMRYYVLHKPVGVISTLHDPEGRRTIRDFLPPGSRLFPVGRLDADTSGLLVLTNDGEIAHRLMHPRYGVQKSYRVRLERAPDAAQLARLASGVEFEPGVVSAPARVRVVDESPDRAMLSIIIHEGRYRQVRRMCEAVGLTVLGLHRSAYGPLHLGELGRGMWRELSEGEIARLRAASARPVRPGGQGGRYLGVPRARVAPGGAGRPGRGPRPAPASVPARAPAPARRPVPAASPARVRPRIESPGGRARGRATTARPTRGRQQRTARTPAAGAPVPWRRTRPLDYRKRGAVRPSRPEGYARRGVARPVRVVEDRSRGPVRRERGGVGPRRGVTRTVDTRPRASWREDGRDGARRAPTGGGRRGPAKRPASSGYPAAGRRGAASRPGSAGFPPAGRRGPTSRPSTAGYPTDGRNSRGGRPAPAGKRGGAPLSQVGRPRRPGDMARRSGGAGAKSRSPRPSRGPGARRSR